MASVRIRGALRLQMQAKAMPQHCRLLPIPSPREDDFPLLHVPLQHTLLCAQCLRVSRAHLEADETMRLPVSSFHAQQLTSH